MNSLTNLTPASIRRTLLVAALVVCPFLAIQSGNAQTPTVAATLTNNGSSSITITGNQQFTMTLAVQTNFTSSGYTVFYQSNNGSGLFRIVARQNLSPLFNGQPIFNDPTTPDSVAFSGNNSLLDPVNNNDLGYTGNSFDNQPPGSYSLQMVTINTLNAAPGTYTIFLDTRSIMTNSANFTDVPMSATFTVNVIPEPTTVGLAVIGGGVLLIGAWRKRRAQG